jgi:glycosyltransferase involved in cell wall biosynthesis
MMQCNDFFACAPGWESYVDHLVAPSGTLLEHLLSETSFPRDKARVFHNGHRVEASTARRIPGRLLWASSADRGLHWALQAFQQVRQTYVDPQTRQAFPPLNLELRVAYDDSGMKGFAALPEDATPDSMAELGRRSRYCLSALGKVPGVTRLGSLSRDDIAREMQEAELLLYPCDPVSFTEGFSSSTLEAMASGCLPVLAFADAFPELWKGAVPGVTPIPAFTADGSRHPRAWLWSEKQYIAIVRALLSGQQVEGKTLEQWRTLAKERAEMFRWSTLVPALADFLEGNTEILPTLSTLRYPWGPQ